MFYAKLPREDKRMMQLNEFKNEQQSFINEMCKKLYKNNEIDSSYYQKYDVKRGLRNSNGTGVLVGLTQIGDVQGYEVENGVKIPVDGKLLYRGIDVEDIVKSCLKEKRYGYEETSYLLLFGELPNKEQLKMYNQILGENRDVPNNFTKDMILTAPSKNIMNKLARSVLALYSYDPNPDDISIENVLIQSINLIARFPALISYGYQAKIRYYDNASLHLHYPSSELSTAENILHLIRPNSEYTKLEAVLLDLALILHAEHGGGNNSAFTTHVVSSSGTDTYSAIASAVCSLKGPKHGGANTVVLEMIKDLKENVDDYTDQSKVEEYLVKVIKGEAFDRTGLVYGMGHAVYTKSDPRAVMLKDWAKKLAEEKGMQEEFMLYDFIEKRSLDLLYEIKGIDKPICANVDLYSGFVYSALNIPMELCTPIFAASRISGWCAHRIEELVAGGRIMRPAYKHVKEHIPYIPIENR